MSRRLKNCIRGRMPKVNAARDFLTAINPDELRGIHDGIVHRMKRNRIWEKGTIVGYRVAAADGVELFSSTKKSCPDCLTRRHGVDGKEHFHRSVVCMTVGEPLRDVGGGKAQGWESADIRWCLKMLVSTK